MSYIEGIGYVNDATYIGETVGGVTLSATRPEEIVKSDFDRVLEQETDKVKSTGNGTEKVYDLAAIIHEAAETYGVSEKLLTAMAYTESGFNPTVTSSAGAMGIMQLMPYTARSYGVTDPYDPYENIMAGAQVLAGFQTEFNGDETLMIAAYNAGPNAVKRYGGIPPYAETQRHVQKVYNFMEQGVTAPTAVTYDPATKTSEVGPYSAYQTLASAIRNTTVNTAVSTENAGLAAAQNALNTVKTSNMTDQMRNSLNELDRVLNETQYQVLVYFYQKMLDIVASMGSSNTLFDEDYSDLNSDSLTDLFSLSRMYSNLKNV